MDCGLDRSSQESRRSQLYGLQEVLLMLYSVDVLDAGCLCFLS